jgi:hypothetical protein
VQSPRTKRRVKTFEFGAGSGFSRPEYMASDAMLKPREQAMLGNGIGRSYDKAQASYDRCVSTQRTAASASNPIIQRAILFEPERVPVSPFFCRRFSMLALQAGFTGGSRYMSLPTGRCLQRADS